MAKLPQFEICDHPTSANHCLVKARYRGRVYAISWALPISSPDIEEVKRIWLEERGAFRPYDESGARYL
jgi:hypothetical protein